MSDTPKFEVIDRRKYKAEEQEHEETQRNAAEAAIGEPQPSASPSPQPAVASGPLSGPQLVTDDLQDSELTEDDDLDAEPSLPPAPSAEESYQQKSAYDASARRLEDLVRAQNPGVGPQPPVSFEHLVQQFYVSAMIQMGAGTAEGQRPRVDILGAKQTIDLMEVLAEKTKGNLSETEDRVLQSVLYEVRMAFLELTNMITLQGMQPPVPPPGKR